MRSSSVLLLWIFGITLLSPSPGFSAEKLKLAVADLDALGVAEHVALSTSELFRTELFKTGYFHVLERKQMKKVLEEQALQLSGALAAEDAAEIGKLLAVHLIVFGSINQLGRDLVLTIRLVDVEEGRLKAADTANAKGLEGIQEVVRKLSKVIAEATPLRGKVVKVRGDEVIVSLGKADRVSAGDFLRVQRLGEAFKDPTTGKTLGREIIEVATLKVDQIINDDLSRTLLVEKFGSVQTGDIVIIWTGGVGEGPEEKKEEAKPKSSPLFPFFGSSPSPEPSPKPSPQPPPEPEKKPSPPSSPTEKKKPALPPPTF